MNNRIRELARPRELALCLPEMGLFCGWTNDSIQVLLLEKVSIPAIQSLWSLLTLSWANKCSRNGYVARSLDRDIP